MVALTEPEPGVGELALRVVVCVTEDLPVDVAADFDWREAVSAVQGGEVGEGEGEFLFDFEEGHGWWNLCWSGDLVM